MDQTVIQSDHLDYSREEAIKELSSILSSIFYGKKKLTFTKAEQVTGYGRGNFKKAVDGNVLLGANIIKKLLLYSTKSKKAFEFRYLININGDLDNYLSISLGDEYTDPSCQTKEDLQVLNILLDTLQNKESLDAFSVIRSEKILKIETLNIIFGEDVASNILGKFLKATIISFDKKRSLITFNEEMEVSDYKITLLYDKIISQSINKDYFDKGQGFLNSDSYLISKDATRKLVRLTSDFNRDFHQIIYNDTEKKEVIMRNSFLYNYDILKSGPIGEVH